jgi:GNAT superfamily N-acetyltransferase
MNGPENFTQALIAAYLKNPCQVLPNALWKSLPWADRFQTNFQVEDGFVTQLSAYNSGQLMLFWNRDRHSSRPLPLDDRNSLEFALLHKDFETLLDLETFHQHHCYFRLIHPLQGQAAPNLLKGFSFTAANPVAEAVEIANLISACYEDINLTPEVVRGWVDHPVFDSDLWIWVIDERCNTPAGLGIAELDTTIAEGSLEWIQVLPAYRGKGLGKQIVCELLKRLTGRAKFTTVAGQVNNKTHPERIYRNCGFEGNDLWWVLEK